MLYCGRTHATYVLESLFTILSIVYGWQVATRNSCGSGSPLDRSDDWINRIKREVSVLDGGLLLSRVNDPVILVLVNDDFSIDTLQERKINTRTHAPFGDNEFFGKSTLFSDHLFIPLFVCIFSLKIINDITISEVVDTEAA